METQNKNRKSNVKFIAWIVALSVLAACLLSALIAVFAENSKHKSNIEMVYKARAYELGDSMNNLQVVLSKLMVTEGDKACSITLLSEGYRHCEISADALATLNIEGLDSESALKFINQVGDYCKAKITTLAYGLKIIENQAKVETLYETVVSINKTYGEYLKKVESGEIKFFNLKNNYQRMEGGDQEMQHNSVEYPELIYDGPFSDGKKGSDFKALEGMPEVTEAQAIEKFKKETGYKGEVTLAGNSTLVHGYELSGKNDEVYATVSAKGGMLINYSNFRLLGKPMLNEENATIKALNFIKSLGYSNMQSVWYSSAAGSAVINLAPIIDDVVYYPDLIKIKVALDNGEILGLESMGYCLNHCARQVDVKVNKNTILNNVDKKLTDVNVRMVVIPFGTNEKLCYEVTGMHHDLAYLIYYNCENNNLIKVLRTIDNDQGHFTI